MRKFFKKAKAIFKARTNSENVVPKILNKKWFFIF